MRFVFHNVVNGQGLNVCVFRIARSDWYVGRSTLPCGTNSLKTSQKELEPVVHGGVGGYTLPDRDQAGHVSRLAQDCT